MADTANCPNCGKAFVQFAPLSSTTMKAFCCDCAEPEPTLADVLTELQTIRKLLERVSSGGVAVRTRSVNS